MQQALEIAVRAFGLKPNDPGFQIAAGPRPLSMTDDPRIRLLTLMNNFFDFGRGPGNWQWQSGLGTANGPSAYSNPKDRGINLLNGTCSVTNCDGFRSAFINLATNVLHIDGVGYRSIGPIPDGGYLTPPGTVVIDSHWVGNVRTEQRDFAQVGSFKFSEHHFATFQARIYDPTTNMTFGNEDEMKWCTYTLERDARIQAQFRQLRLFRIDAVLQPNGVCHAPRYLAEIGSSGGWPTNLLTAGDQLNLGALALMTAGSSRI